MDGSTCVLFERQRLHDHVVASFGLFDVDEFVGPVVDAEQVRVTKFANLALEVFPEQRCVIFGLAHLHLEV